MGPEGHGHSPVSFLHIERKRFALQIAINPYVRKVEVSEMLFVQIPKCMWLD